MRSHSGNSRVQLGSGDRVKRCPSEGPASELDQHGRRCVETSGNVISFVFLEKQRSLSSFISLFFGRANRKREQCTIFSSRCRGDGRSSRARCRLGAPCCEPVRAGRCRWRMRCGFLPRLMLRCGSCSNERNHIGAIAKHKGHPALSLNALRLRVSPRAFRESDGTTPGGNRLSLMGCYGDYIRTVA